MSYFNGNLIDGKSAYSWLLNNASKISNDASICSAFLRSSIIRDLELHFPPHSSLRVMVRWQLSDLLAGASDLEAYEVCRSRGWKFFLCLNFHGKVYHLPNYGIMVGSANATESGFGKSSKSNSEACTIVNENSLNIKFIDDLFFDSLLMDDELFEKIKNIFNLALKDSSIQEWPDEILKEFEKPGFKNCRLFLSECFKTNGEEIISCSRPLSEDAKFDLSLLGLAESNYEINVILQQFKKTKIYFLLTQIINLKGGEVYFGSLTAALHDWLLEDPVPHRRDVKVLVKNLYGWLVILEGADLPLLVDRPNHSERISIR